MITPLDLPALASKVRTEKCTERGFVPNSISKCVLNHKLNWGEKRMTYVMYPNRNAPRWVPRHGKSPLERRPRA